MNSLLIKVLLPVLILLIGGGTGIWLMNNPPKAKKRPGAVIKTILVETGIAETGYYNVTIEAMGQVIPAMQAIAKPQISGEIINVAEEFIPGGFFIEGEVILNIDPEDYELVVQKQNAALIQAQADYRLEMGRQSIAKDELEILARTTGRNLKKTELALRGPQLEQAKAELEKAESDLDAAILNVRRTAINSPFNALVTKRNVTLGDKVSMQDALATLVSTDEYWVEISVPVDELQWLDIPRRINEPGSAAKIIMDGNRGVRTGYLLKLTGSLDQGSRLASLLVSVPDPLLLNTSRRGKNMPLILGDYVKVMLEGRRLENNVMRLNLAWLRDGNIVWIATKDGHLKFMDVEVIYEDREYAYAVFDLSDGKQIISSNIPVPVDGMKIRTMEEAKREVLQKMQGPKGTSK